MKDFVELTKNEAILVDGGGAYEIGYAIGAWCANAVDFMQGLYAAL